MSAERAAAFVDAARRYSELGWALVRAEGKRPKGLGWEKTKPEPPDLAAGKWSQWGKALNIGVVCGTSRVAVLDVDVDVNPEGALLGLLGMDTLPLTPISRTGRGRLQAFFADPGGLEKAVDGQGIELRVGPHQCIVWPSVHPDSGRTYRWLIGHEPWDVPLAPLPTVVVEHFGALQRHNGTAPAVGDVIHIGTIDRTLASLAGTMRRRGMSEDAICAALVVELDRCEPGHTHTEDDCRRIAHSVAKYDPADARPEEPSPLMVHPATSSDDLVATSSEGDLVVSSLLLRRETKTDTSSTTSSAPPQGPHSWLPVDVVARAANPPAPPELLELFYVGSNHLLSGESEALKTWLELAAASVELREGRGVLWVDGDGVGSGALVERLRLLGVEDDAISAGFAYVLPEEPLTEERRSDVLEVVRARGCRLAVFDGFNPLLTLHGFDPNVGSDVERFYTLIDPIRKQGTATVLGDNVVKSSESRGAWAIGSERKKSKAEVHLGMRAVGGSLVRGGKGKAKIDVHKDRPGHLTRPTAGIFVVEAGGVFTWRIDADDSRDEQGAFRPTVLMLKVSQFLERRIDEPQSRNKIEQAKLGGAEHIRLAIDRLVGEGYAEEFAGPREARLVRLKRPFADDEDETA